MILDFNYKILIYNQMNSFHPLINVFNKWIKILRINKIFLCQYKKNDGDIRSYDYL